MFYIKENYINWFLFDLINQNYLLIFFFKNLNLFFSINFSLLIKSFDFFDKNIFNFYYFLEWFSNFRPFLHKNKLISHLRLNYLYNFLIFLDFFILKYNNISDYKIDWLNSTISFSIKSYRLIPFLPSIFYNFKIPILINFKFNNFFNFFKMGQKKNYIIFFFNKY